MAAESAIVTRHMFCSHPPSREADARIAKPWRAAVLLTVVSLILGVSIPADANQSSAPPKSNNFDGPAELPRQHVKSSLSDTPAGGKTWTVHAGENFQQALANASCGDV